MEDEYELITSATITKSMIRKIGENQYLKIIPSEKRIEISTIKQKKITEPREQVDEIVIQAKKLVVIDNMLNLSNILSMIIKQNTLEKKIENIKDDLE